ncbi:MAG: hypothetical protein HC889_05955 [Synechococcaceae cyanobacterium SM1_2_3]|nr:hypothetical protein [Synechococcaceae cyanobacterium SM1_2_3]
MNDAMKDGMKDATKDAMKVLDARAKGVYLITVTPFTDSGALDLGDRPVGIDELDQADEDDGPSASA